MDINCYVETIENVEINNEIVKSIEDLYSASLPESVQRIVSVVLDDYFISEQCRVISLKEILNTEEFTGVDFTSINMLPLIDCKDDDYIVYDFGENRFVMYNIYDEVGFREAESLKMLLETLGDG